MKKNSVAALSPHSHPRSVAWRVDMDYTHRLGPEDRAWLAAFVDRHYAGDFRGDVGPDYSTEERRASYRAKNAANRDVMTVCVPTLNTPDEPAVEFDDIEPDDGLDTDSPAYRSARDAYRRDPSPANRVRLSRARTQKRPIGG